VVLEGCRRHLADEKFAIWSRNCADQVYGYPMPTKLPKSDLIRLNVNLNPETAKALRDIADTRGISFTEAIRRCISVYTYVAAAGADGKRVSVIDPAAGTERELVLL
jgi:hypothetical protein